MDPHSVDVDWETARLANRDNWEDRVPLHEVAYKRESFADPNFISGVVRTDLEVLERFLPAGTVEGLDLCHLQCHIGTDSLSFARLGAHVTGVDFSPAALRSAAELTRALGLSATWVETDVLEARVAVTGDFDVVYTSIGTITWLADLDQWARQVFALLRPGGVFYIRDGHPALYSIDENADGLVIRYPYFNDGEALQWDSESTYSGSGMVAHTRTYEWHHSFSDILSSLLRAGLQIVHVEEGRTLPWKFSDRMVDVPEGFAWPEKERNLVPCTYTIVARKI